MAKLLNDDEGSELFFLDVPEGRWHELPDCELGDR
jgi:hypothetical protein